MLTDKWHKRFIELAKNTSSFSKDPSTKVGAVIVDPKTKTVVSMGYNGFPRGIDDSEIRYNDRETKLRLIVHAELNAILNAGRSVEGCHMYIWPTLSVPNSCPECAKAIAQSGIDSIYYEENNDVPARWQDIAKFSKIILSESGVRCVAIKKGRT